MTGAVCPSFIAICNLHATACVWNEMPTCYLRDSRCFIATKYLSLYLCQLFSTEWSHFVIRWWDVVCSSSSSSFVEWRRPAYSSLGWVVRKAISANPGIKLNCLFIFVCSAWQLKLKLSKAKHFIICMISEQKFSNVFVYIFIILSTKFPQILD